MTRPHRALVIAVAAVATLAATVVVAQSDRISIAQAPRPGQTVKMTLTQNMDMDLTFDGAPIPSPGLGPMKMAMQTAMEMTQKTGEARPDGTYDAELTYSQVRAVVEMNGQPLPTDGVQNQVEGKTITVTYDASGRIVDVKDLPAANLPADVLRQLMASFYGNLPSTIGVGETVTTPLNFNLPLPIPGGAPLKMTGETKMKLVSVGTDAGARIARFESTSDGKMSGDEPAPTGAGRTTFDFTLRGAGTSVFDLEKGVLRSSETRSTFSGKLTPSGSAPAVLPGMILQGTIHVSIASN